MTSLGEGMVVRLSAATVLGWLLAACLLGGCSTGRIQPTHTGAKNPPGDRPAIQATKGTDVRPSAESKRPLHADEDPGGPTLSSQLRVASLDDSQLGDIRGGLETGSGVELNFAFQQATFVDHNLVQNVVIPTLTVAQQAGTVSATMPTGTPLIGHDPQAPTLKTAALAGLGMTGAPAEAATTLAKANSLVSNGTSVQITSPGAAIPTVLGYGATSVVSTLGGGGLTNIVANTANNQLIQQVTTINIGITGLQQLLQQGVPGSVMSQLNAVNALRH